MRKKEKKKNVRKKKKSEKKRECGRRRGRARATTENNMRAFGLGSRQRHTYDGGPSFLGHQETKKPGAEHLPWHCARDPFRWFEAIFVHVPVDVGRESIHACYYNLLSSRQALLFFFDHSYPFFTSLPYFFCRTFPSFVASPLLDLHLDHCQGSSPSVLSPLLF